jgi:YfiH family protein
MKYLTTDLEKLKFLKHGFFTRIGGMSAGVYQGLNCAYSSGDDQDSITANRAKVAETLGVEVDQLITVKQVHGAKVITVTEPFKNKPPEADGIVTATRGLAIGVLTADCAPVLFADKKARIIGAAHAGWKGAVGGIIEATVEAMIALGAKRENIQAAIGPCIGPLSYEVSADFKKTFLEQDTANERFFKQAAKEGHFIFNLPGYAVHRLKKAGIETVYDTQQDTLPNEDAYYSYRRSCQRQETDYGRQMSAIVLL